MGDRIVVLDRGRIEQVGTPAELYGRPAGLFVAEFIGSPKMNVIEGPAAQAAGASAIGVRPEHCAVSLVGGTWAGRVAEREYLGSDTFLRVAVDGVGEVLARAGGGFAAQEGDRVFLTPDPAHIHRFDAGGRAMPASG